MCSAQSRSAPEARRCAARKTRARVQRAAAAFGNAAILACKVCTCHCSPVAALQGPKARPRSGRSGRISALGAYSPRVILPAPGKGRCVVTSPPQALRTGPAMLRHFRHCPSFPELSIGMYDYDRNKSRDFLTVPKGEVSAYSCCRLCDSIIRFGRLCCASHIDQH